MTAIDASEASPRPGMRSDLDGEMQALLAKMRRLCEHMFDEGRADAVRRHVGSQAGPSSSANG